MAAERVRRYEEFYHLFNKFIRFSFGQLGERANGTYI